MTDLDPLKLIKLPWVHNIIRVGTICKHWARIEYLFALTIWQMLNLDAETGKIVTGGLDMLPRVNIAINLARHTQQPKPVIKVLESARSAIQDKLDARRNRAVHGVVFLDENFAYETEVHRGRGNRQRQPLPTAELDSLCSDLLTVIIKLQTELSSYVPSVAEAALHDMLRMEEMSSAMRRSSPSSPK
jgi:hypothetical protein